MNSLGQTLPFLQQKEIKLVFEIVTYLIFIYLVVLNQICISPEKMHNLYVC